MPAYSFSRATLSEDNPSSIGWSLEVRNSNSKDSVFQLDREHKVCIVACDHASLVAKDIEVLLQFLFCDLYAQDDIWCAHGIGLLSPAGCGVLLIGNYGDGKSTVALRLMQKGYRFIGNDRVLLAGDCSGVYMLAGSRPIRMRAGVISQYLPELLPTVFKPTSVAAIDTLGGGLVSLPLEVYQEATNVPIRVTHVYRVRLCPAPSEYQTLLPFETIDGRASILKLYQSVSLFMINHSLIHLGLLEPFPAIDTLERARHRLQLCNDIQMTSKCAEVYGSLEWITSNINRECEGSFRSAGQAPV